MGFETFRAELDGGPATFADADAAVRALPHARPDADEARGDGSAYYLIDDGRHVIEVEVADAPARVSCRFTLSHPPTVDAAFTQLVCSLAKQLGMTPRVCDDVAPGLSFADAVRAAVAVRRAEWVAMFGPAVLAAASPEVYRQIILPRCVPVAG